MRKIDLILALAVSLFVVSPMTARADPVPMHLTCYCPESCPGTTTYTGARVREGIVAVSDEHIGDCAIVYTVSGDMIGIYECLDRLGTNRSNVIDIWRPSIHSARLMMAVTRGKCLVEFVPRPKG